MSSLDISPAKIEEAEAIARLVNDAYRGHNEGGRGWTGVEHLLEGPRVVTDRIIAWIEDPTVALLVARDGEQCFGCVLLSIIRPHIGEISLLSISVVRQNAGLGRALLREAERWLRDTWQCSHAELTVLSPRPELEGWYRRMGYAETGRVRALRSDGEGYGIPKSSSLTLTEFSRTLQVRPSE